MKTVFREVDFTEFHFTRHMLSALKAVSEEKFALVEDELKSAWTARMRTLVQKIEGKTVLLWISGTRQDGHDDLGPEPLMVDEEMVAAIRPFATELVHVTPSSAARNSGTAGMRFAPLEEPAALVMPGPRVHQEVAEALSPVLKRVLKA
jgi:hypothetical protein